MRSRFSLVAALFLISGATGLLYQVAFSKLLAYVFGATAYAISTVLSAFMGGLALGAHLGGRRAARIKRPLFAYGIMEMAVGLVCAASPYMFSALTDIYVRAARSAPESITALTILRGALTALVVVIPTAAMGATLPLLSRVVAGEHRAGSDRRLSGLYAINTAGGALGALLSAFVILPTLGIRWTMWTAALVNIGIGLIAALAGRSEISQKEADHPVAETPKQAPAISAPEDEESETRASLLPILAFTSGFLVFAAEVIETHLLALLIGNSAYAFGLMLAVFLVCLSLGAARAPAFAKRHKHIALALGLGAAALSIALTRPFWDLLPFAFAFAGKYVSSWGGREAVRAASAFIILSLSTYWMGTTFPLLLSRIASRPDVAAHVGRLTVANTVGTIAGSIVTGYFVLPWLGSERALDAVALCFAAAALITMLASPRAKKSAASLLSPPFRIPTALAAAAFIAILLLPRWNMARLTSGANVYFTLGPPPDRIAFVREDVHGGVTTVTAKGPITTMYTNGKFQGDNGPEMPAQRRFAHFPSLFVKEEKRALVIGLGTGTTLGTIAAYPYKHIDVAEISPAIVDAAQIFFREPSLNALDDPRVKLVLNDGRNVLLVANQAYDLVTIELTSVWFAGAASLYSHEFYELVKSRLSRGGILQQWVQLHHIRRRELATIIHTLRGVFPHVALFVGGAQGILVAGTEPLVASEQRLSRLENTPPLKAILGTTHLHDLLGELVASQEDLDRFVLETESEGGALTSTDDNLYLEYATPKGNVLDYNISLRATLDLLARYRTSDVRARHLGP